MGGNLRMFGISWVSHRNLIASACNVLMLAPMCTSLYQLRGALCSVMASSVGMHATGVASRTGCVFACMQADKGLCAKEFAALQQCFMASVRPAQCMNRYHASVCMG